MSQSDHSKRKELLAEFVYYLIDSFAIPLIRSNFHVTESNTQKYKLHYFRQDVWRRVTEPAINELKTNMFQELRSDAVQELLRGRSLGYSQIRLVPKAATFRPIMNLRRRPEYLSNGQRLLGKCINSTLTPAFKALSYEAVRRFMIEAILNLTSIVSTTQSSRKCALFGQ